MKILVSGIGGHMGREVAALCEAGYRGAVSAGGVDPFATGEHIYHSYDDIPADAEIDCVVDFSIHTATPELLGFAATRGIPVVVATTGHTPEEKTAIETAAGIIPVFYSANMSLGVALLVELAKTAVRAMPDADIEIVETHHNRKLDAPSGTALMLANAIHEVREDSVNHCGRAGQVKREKNEIGIHAVRHGNIVGIHEVIVGTATQTITLKHEAHSRALFAEGALAAAAFLVGRDAGLYDMRSLVAD